MDYQEPKVKRNKKSDKAKRNFERTGGLSQKHVRVQNATAKKGSRSSHSSSS